MPPENYSFSFNAFSCVGLSIYFLDLPFGIRSGDLRKKTRRNKSMNIAPDSKIYFLQNIKLDDGYINTLNWASLEDQERYFISNTYFSADALSYVRYADGVIRVKGSTRVFYKCNYMMFKNTSFENKWFYAFIKKIDYVNNSTTEITYDIDVFQTWFAVPRFNDVFVEREHVADDTVGLHTLDEGIPTGYMVSFGGGKKFNIEQPAGTNINEMDIILETTFQIAGDGSLTANIAYLGGVLRGTNMAVFKSSARDQLAYVLGWINNRGLGDGIVAIYMFPDFLLDTEQITKPLAYLNGSFKDVTYYTIKDVIYNSTAKVSFSTKLMGYTPKNKKLLCYPYCFAYASNGSGKNIVLKYEFDAKENNTFEANYFAQPSANGTLMAQLRLKDQDVYMFELPIGGFPQVAYSYDKYSDYLALNQNKLEFQKTQMGVNSITGAVSLGVAGAVTGFKAGGVYGAVAGAALGVGNSVWQSIQGFSQISAEKADIDAQPNGLVGSAQTPDTLLLQDRYALMFHQMCIRPEYAKIIDDFFSRYGYKVSSLKTPSITTRKNWNYIQTVGATIPAEMPAEVESKICSILDRGITFWHHPETMLDYSQDNTPA